ncbi:MAG: MarR family transcriptional regulator [Hoeflea sp.]|uniref:MarR family winged helix-turn-helix transcriptional regulator n=1 Tax=Hoeflea sp. TaxID=1940281 RepID=UPI002730F794|nr:MarR family transcriptional regulator [Hoeflea sp.]MDP2119193.1 MarR family transcriptional regulator [Hoeflea sp.]
MKKDSAGAAARHDAGDNPPDEKSRQPKAKAVSSTSAKLENTGVPLDVSYLEGTIGYSIRRAEMTVFQDIYRAFDKMNVTTAQFSVMAVVADNPGANQADLAAALGVERPRMVPLIDALEARGWATRTPDPTDRRNRHIFLTEAGAEALAELKRRFAKHQKNMLKRLGTDDPSTILTMLWRLARASK